MTISYSHLSGRSKPRQRGLKEKIDKRILLSWQGKLCQKERKDPRSSQPCQLYKVRFFMHKIWLPPIETCYSQVKIEFVLAENFDSHLHLDCRIHGSKFISNPLSQSRYDIKIKPSVKLRKLVKRYSKGKKAHNEAHVATRQQILAI